MLDVLFSHIRRTGLEGALNEAKVDQTVFNSFAATPESRSRHWEVILSLRTKEFDRSHMPNPLGRNTTN